MNKFRSRLLLALLVLIIIVLVGLGLLLGQLFKNFYFQTFQERMEKKQSLWKCTLVKKASQVLL